MNGSTNAIPARMGSRFDPTKYLRKTVGKTGEPLLRLPLTYQKFWFRQTCPSGRMLLKPLRLTDQLAIFEAQVYLHRDDPAPAGSFTANKMAKDNADYIRAAQDEALSEALDNAGFGYQAQGMEQTAGGDIFTPPIPQGQPAPAAQEAPAAPAPADTQAAYWTVESSAAVEPAPAPDPQQAAQVAAAQTVTSPDAVEGPAAAAQTAPASDPPPSAQSYLQQDGPAPKADSEPAQMEHRETLAREQRNDGQQSSLAPVLSFPGQTMEAAGPQESPAPAAAVTNQAAPTSKVEPSYTEDMPVEQICQMMTLEEARQVVVTKGTCNGWTMAQVAEKRPSSLRFYLSGFGHVNNIQLAAATLLQQELDLKKAG